MSYLRMEQIPDPRPLVRIEAVKVTANFGYQDSWPEWMKSAWRTEQPLDGPLPAGMVVPDDMGNGVRVGAGNRGYGFTEVANQGDYVIYNVATGELCADTEAALFRNFRAVYEEEESE